MAQSNRERHRLFNERHPGDTQRRVAKWRKQNKSYNRDWMRFYRGSYRFQSFDQYKELIDD